jgi:hypothetical protein
MGLNLTQKQYKLIYDALQKYREIYSIDNYMWEECDEIIDEITPFVYTQRQEQPT